MPTPSPCCGRACLSADAINDAIRRLMSRPADKARTAEYQRLLEQWADTCPREDHCWTTAA
ncbi:hypothetical protein [Streptomyces sp. KHY 26]|uniref:hypothetical protein n=1 Tax=Streptomyces sp. KHY 26 TaxID=3097359 RepID=UPI00376EF787